MLDYLASEEPCAGKNWLDAIAIEERININFVQPRSGIARIAYIVAYGYETIGDTQIDLSEPRSGVTEQPRPSGLGKFYRNPP